MIKGYYNIYTIIDRSGKRERETDREKRKIERVRDKQIERGERDS